MLLFAFDSGRNDAWVFEASPGCSYFDWLTRAGRGYSWRRRNNHAAALGRTCWKSKYLVSNVRLRPARSSFVAHRFAVLYRRPNDADPYACFERVLGQRSQPQHL